MNGAHASHPGPIPLTLLTGFLGAGKTTVLNHILGSGHGLRVAVLVNDFGDLDIAEELVDGRADGTLRLTNGCICCSLKEGLVEAVAGLLHREPRPQHIVLEASGVADPTGIATTLLAPVFRGAIRLDGVVCVVDAREFCIDHAEQDLILRQLMVSDLILLNKADTVDLQSLDQAEGLIKDWLSQARILRCRRGDVPLEVLLSSLHEHDPASDPHAEDCRDEHCAHGSQDHRQRFDTLRFQSSQPICPDALGAQLRELPGSVYRVKGVIRTPQPDERWRVIQGVGRRLDTSPAPLQPPGSCSRLVVIGAAGAMPREELRRRLESCARD